MFSDIDALLDWAEEWVDWCVAYGPQRDPPPPRFVPSGPLQERAARLAFVHAAQSSGSLRETLEGTEAWSVLEQAFAAAENEVLEQELRRLEHEQAAAQQGQR